MPDAAVARHRHRQLQRAAPSSTRACGRSRPHEPRSARASASSTTARAMARRRCVRDGWPAVQLIEPAATSGSRARNNLGIRATSERLRAAAQSRHAGAAGRDLHARRATRRPTRRARPSARASSIRTARPELSFGWTMSPLGELRQKVARRASTSGGSGRSCAASNAGRASAGAREWVSGACLLVRRADLDAVGLLRRALFHVHGGRRPLRRRCARVGKTILFVPEAEVTHLRGRSAGRNPQTERLRRQSQLAYYAKHHPGVGAAARGCICGSGDLAIW